MKVEIEKHSKLDKLTFEALKQLAMEDIEDTQHPDFQILKYYIELAYMMGASE